MTISLFITINEHDISIYDIISKSLHLTNADLQKLVSENYKFGKIILNNNNSVLSINDNVDHILYHLCNWPKIELEESFDVPYYLTKDRIKIEFENDVIQITSSNGESFSCNKALFLENLQKTCFTYLAFLNTFIKLQSADFKNSSQLMLSHTNDQHKNIKHFLYNKTNNSIGHQIAIVLIDNNNHFYVVDSDAASTDSLNSFFNKINSTHEFTIRTSPPDSQAPILTSYGQTFKKTDPNFYKNIKEYILQKRGLYLLNQQEAEVLSGF